MQSVKKKTEQEAKKNAPVKAEPVEQKYSVEMLRAHCVKIFGITSSTFDGAFYGHDEDMTIKEAKKVVNDWLGKEVK